MAMVGPRPERPEFVEELAQAVPYYEPRHLTRPGITGWAQVQLGYAAPSTTPPQALVRPLLPQAPQPGARPGHPAAHRRRRATRHRRSLAPATSGRAARAWATGSRTHIQAEEQGAQDQLRLGRARRSSGRRRARAGRRRRPRRARRRPDASTARSRSPPGALPAAKRTLPLRSPCTICDSRSNGRRAARAIARPRAAPPTGPASASPQAARSASPRRRRARPGTAAATGPRARDAARPRHLRIASQRGS